MSTMTTHPATEKQIAFITRLLGERDATGTAYEGWTPDWSRATSKAASTVIDFLLSLPKKAVQEQAEAEAGVYETPDLRWFRVYLGQQSGHMLVKEVHAEHDLMGEMEVSYEYLGSAASKLPHDARRMSLEEVGRLGIATNHCMICGRRLDDPESVDLGIGPVCASKY